MHMATTSRSFGASTLRLTAFLERRFRANVTIRDRLLFDSAHVPPVQKPSSFVHLYAQLRGAFSIDGGPPVSGPQAYALDETEFDRRTPGSPTFRSWGGPGVIVEVRVSATDLRVPVGLRNGPLTLPSRVWDAYGALAADPSAARLHEVIVRLGETQILSSDVAASVVPDEPERFVRLWEVLRPLYEDLSTSSSLKQIAVVAKLSLRQLGRDLGEFTRTFGLYGGGFREAIRILRLRAAVLMLSSPDGTPSDVARLIGYGSLDAMGRAFRDARLPAPSVVQDAVRYPDVG
ncbi:MAG TPA: AraC family transcriptional regulator [Kofleriaceae bacterium]|nr:AraC family transcriptional regulator [Kofleriaceae bacterium]